MDKKRLRVALKVLDAVKTKFPETKQFIDNTMEDESQKDEVILICGWGNFFNKPRSKELAQKNVFCLAVSMLRDIVLS